MRWRRAFEPLSREHGFERLEIEGTLPPGLRGTLYRVGPASFAAGVVVGEAFGHWFDGDGAVTAVRLDGGTATGACRFVATRERGVEQRLGRLAFRGFGTDAPRRAAPLVKRPVNVGALWWQERLYALGEGASPHRVAPDSLETAGADDLGGALQSAFAGHPHRAPGRPAAYNFGVRYGPRFSVDLYQLPDEGGARRLCTVPLRSPRYLHDFAVTGRRALFLFPPLEADIDALLHGSGALASAFLWKPDGATEILSIELDPPHRVTWTEADPFFHWHVARAAESADGEVAVDLVRYPDFTVNRWFAALPYREPEPAPPGQLARVRLSPGRERARQELLSDVPCELPAPAGGGAILALAHSPSASRTAPYDALALLDPDRHPPRWLSLGPDRFPSGEPCVVGERYGLSLGYDARAHRSGLAVLDLEAPDSGPAAWAWFDHHLPFAFHGAWVTARW